MTTEREMLEYAAKTLGFHYVDGESWDDNAGWNSLIYSADCAAMCAKLEIDTMWFSDQVECDAHPVQDNSFGSIYSQFNNDREAAWRYAATMVAAKIGGMK